MRLDEMIIKANSDGKTYFNPKDEVTYSSENGFIGDSTADVWVDGWKELTKRHLTVSEAEKELDCVIDTPDISNLVRPANEPPSDYRTVFIIRKNLSSSRGYYSGDWNRYQSGDWKCSDDVTFWIDPEDLIKLLPKE